MAEAGGNGGDAALVGRIHEALQAVHGSGSTNDARREAHHFLESVKELPQAPFEGYGLASDKNQPPVVRHYALSLLEHAFRYQWASFTEEQVLALRNWVIELSQAISKDDPIYLRNKTAQLWVEAAKRCWCADWLDMDAMLVQLWQIPESAVHKELVMFVLETLSDEVFSGDDPVVAMREGVLSKACVEIFTQSSVLTESFPNRQAGPEVRCGEEGWLSRLSELLNYCITSEAKENAEVKACAVKALAVFTTLLSWAIPKSVATAQIVLVLASGLNSPFYEIQKGSLESLYSLYYRSNLTDAEFNDLVAPMYRKESVGLWKSLFEWSQTDPEDLDEDKYQIQKKLSETLSCLGDYFERKYSHVPLDSAMNEFLSLLVEVVRSPSLMVSIPVLVTWTKLLTNKAIGRSDLVTQFIGPLLEVCMSRLVRYENLPDDTTDHTYLFLQEDTDTVPERHAFLGNYRRYSSQVIEAITQLKLLDAISHILGRTETVLATLYDGQPAFDKSKYYKHSLPVLQVDSHCTVIEAMLKGYMKWRKHHPREVSEILSRHEPVLTAEEQSNAELESNLEAWCLKLLDMSFDDPLIRRRTLQLLVHFSTTALNQNAGFMLKVLQHILMTWPEQEPEFRTFNEAVKDLQGESMVEMQRLASEMPDDLLGVYDQIEARVNEMLASGNMDEKRTLAYKSFLFLIIHRAKKVDKPTKVQKLREFIDPVKAQWRNEDIRYSLKSYSSFCEFLGLDKAQSYLASRQAHNIREWGSHQLDAEGLELQSQLEVRLKLLPLRPTKAFLAFSVERLSKSSEAFQASYELWQEGYENILADLLEYLSFGHASHNPDNWVGLPAEMRSVVPRVLSDRFWQAGISEGTKDDFYARVVDKKGTLEGLASTIRGSVRFVRETAYAIIYGMSRLDLHFYGFDGLSAPLARALFEDSIWLSTHQQSNLLNLVRYLVDDCPVEKRENFLPQLLNSCFRQMDAKINGEWQKTEKRQVEAADSEAGLKEEMKSESILRQVTYTAVVMVADLLDPTKENPPISTARLIKAETPLPENRQYPLLREFCLAHQEIVEPLLVFCSHVIRMRDSRCCSMILRLFMSLVPEFLVDSVPRKQPYSSPAQEQAAAALAEISPAIREFISTEVLKACITSFHEPYFVEVQKELASLIASIVVNYSSIISTPKDVMLSLPNIKASDLERLTPYIAKPSHHTRQQRSIVLEILKDLKGVSIAEMGKLPKSSAFGSTQRGKKPTRSKMAQEFMSEPAGNGPGETRAGARPRGATPDGLEAVSGLFEG